MRSIQTATAVVIKLGLWVLMNGQSVKLNLQLETRLHLQCFFWLFFCFKTFECCIFNIHQSSACHLAAYIAPQHFAACPSPVFSIHLDLSREHVRFLRLFLAVWLHSTGPQGRLLTGWAPIHMMCLFARRAPAVLEKTRRPQSTTVHCQAAKTRDG